LAYIKWNYSLKCGNLKKLGDEDETGYTLNKDFTEDTWFAKGIGLVRLEQKVEGKSSMTWILK